MDEPTDGSDDPRVDRLRALGAAIRKAREERGFTQTELGERIAELTGMPCPQTTLSRWEAGIVTHDVEQLRAIELALGLTLGSLAGVAGYGELPLQDDEVIVTHYFESIDEALLAVQAAEQLALGVRLSNPELDHVGELRWVVQVYREAPPIGD